MGMKNYCIYVLYQEPPRGLASQKWDRKKDLRTGVST